MEHEALAMHLVLFSVYIVLLCTYQETEKDKGGAAPEFELEMKVQCNELIEPRFVG